MVEALARSRVEYVANVGRRGGKECLIAWGVDGVSCRWVDEATKRESILQLLRRASGSLLGWRIFRPRSPQGWRWLSDL